jgi:radical SAM superfamily enzyme YgiQ (UPF0313 family)
MNVLLVYPQFPDSFWSFKHALPFIRKKAAYPPLGLLTVAAMLPKTWSLRLLDTNVEVLKEKDLAWADCVFVSAMGIQLPSTLEIVEQCRALSKRVVAGGPLFTAQPERFPQIDHLVLGEAEVSLSPFLSDLKQGCAGHLYRATEFACLHQSPAPRWDLVRFSDYSTMSVQYTRGCPYDCEFCDITALFGHRPRTKTASQVIRELDLLYDLGWRGGVFFVDDNLIGNKKLLKLELIPALVERNQTKPGFEFGTQASINLADDPELVKSMVSVGFESVFVGIETPNEASLNECHKLHNVGRDLESDVRSLQRAGLQVQAGFIVGFDSDTPNSFDRLTAFIQRTGIVTAMVGILQALPGTRLFERLSKAGRLSDQGSGYDFNGTTNIVPLMDYSILRSRYAELLRFLYSPRNYYERVVRFLTVYEVPKVRARWNLRYQLRQLAAFARASIRLGLFGRERIEYWKLLVWTLCHKPWALSLAVTLAIYGYHFRVCYERCLRIG